MEATQQVRALYTFSCIIDVQGLIRERAFFLWVSQQVDFIDPALFFNILFGAEKFEKYIGTLKLQNYASAIGEYDMEGFVIVGEVDSLAVRRYTDRAILDYDGDV